MIFDLWIWKVCSGDWRRRTENFFREKTTSDELELGFLREPRLGQWRHSFGPFFIITIDIYLQRRLANRVLACSLLFFFTCKGIIWASGQVPAWARSVFDYTKYVKYNNHGTTLFFFRKFGEILWIYDFSIIYLSVIEEQTKTR